MLVPLEPPRRDASFERDVRFANTINLQPLMQHLSYLKVKFDELERYKKKLNEVKNDHIETITVLDNLSVEAWSAMDYMKKIRELCNRLRNQ